ncbi:MAG: Rieske 2Fe-2S domain-containing protein [Verrucomicrobiota bacterium]
MKILATGTRRKWVKQFLLGSAAALVGPAWSSRVLAEVASTGPGPGVLRIKPSSFPALANPGGSVQLKFIGYLKPLTLNRIAADRFVTLDSVCTHQGCQVGRFIVADNRMRCPCHGSRYDIEGRVFRDANGDSTEPAQNDLGRYVTSYDVAADLVSITIPGLALHVNSVDVHRQGPGERVRLRLVFPVSYDATYEIRYQATPTAPLGLVSFSITPDGPANQTSAGPEFEGDFTAYVDASGASGFFVVGVRLTEV